MFGRSKRHIEALEAELAEARAELAKARADLADRARELQAAEQELGTVRHARDEMATRLAQLRPRPQRDRAHHAVPADFEPLDPEADPPRFVATYRISGPRDQLVTLDLMLRTFHRACDLGSTMCFSVMVDGDGGASLDISRGEHPGGLSDAEEGWLLSDDDEPRPAHLEGAEVERRSETLVFDFV